MKIDWVEPNQIAASGIPLGPKDLRSIKAQGIQAILSLTEHPLSIQNKITKELLLHLGLDSKHVPVRDQYPPREGQVQSIQAYIKDKKAQGKAVLVHCHAGVGRTGTILHAYYLQEGLTLESAKGLIQKVRPSSQYLILSERQQRYLQRLAQELAAAQAGKKRPHPG